MNEEKIENILKLFNDILDDIQKQDGFTSQDRKWWNKLLKDSMKSYEK